MTSDGIDTQICSDFLINEDQNADKLLYYNRVLTADPVNEKYKYVISPPAGKQNFRLSVWHFILISFEFLPSSGIPSL